MNSQEYIARYIRESDAPFGGIQVGFLFRSLYRYPLTNIRLACLLRRLFPASADRTEGSTRALDSAYLHV